MIATIRAARRQQPGACALRHKRCAATRSKPLWTDLQAANNTGNAGRATRLHGSVLAGLAPIHLRYRLASLQHLSNECLPVHSLGLHIALPRCLRMGNMHEQLTNVLAQPTTTRQTQERRIMQHTSKLTCGGSSGYSFRNSGSLEWILGRMVRAAYSRLSAGTEHALRGEPAAS